MIKIYATLLVFCSGFFTATISNAQIGTFQKLDQGVIIHLPKGAESPFLKLEVLSDQIIHVLASEKELLASPISLMRNDAVLKPVNWDLSQQATSLFIKTADLHLEVSLKSGAIIFKDKNGKVILSSGSSSMISNLDQRDSSYTLKQNFTVQAKEAFYGLGQHQNGLINYHGTQVELLQNNTEVAVPFLVSSNHYGILWDNYSLTKAGDVRDYSPLSALKLFTKNKEIGGLTATYQVANSPKDSVVRTESVIDYSFLKDQDKFPIGYKLGSGNIVWEGSFASPFTGEHHFLAKYGGYIKIWIDGKLLVDQWRQSWNPGTALVSLNLVKEEQHQIKIEWNPNGNQSYIALNWLSPIPEQDKNTFSFLSEAGEAINYYFVYGANTDDIISGYRKLTGKATMVPKWAMGLWQSRERYKTQDEIIATVKEFRDRKIPLDNIVLDWSYWKQDQWGSQQFDETRFSNPAKMIADLHQKYNTHFMISVWGKFYEGIEAYNDFDQKGWLYKNNISAGRLDWIGKGYKNTFYDAYNPDARKGFWDLINKNLYQKGVDAWWMDASEPDIHSNMDVASRKEVMNPTYLGSATKYFNAYPLQNAKGIFEGQRETNPNERVFILTRSAYAGQQRYAAATWSGDIGATWADFKAQIPAGINFSLSGIPYWTTDIGGFAVEKRFERPKAADLEEWRELQTRWYQFGAFCPLFRVHGQFPYREIFNIAPENHPAYQSMLYYDQLRYRLMPYIYSLVGQTYLNDYTIMRGLVMDFNDDSLAREIADQYLFGPSLLINPVYSYKARQREVYLPKGNGWYDFYTNKFISGGQKMIADAPLEQMPIYVKEGAIVPFGPDMQYTNEHPADPLTIYVYTGKDASFTLYEDEATNYNYEKGSFATINFNYNQKKKVLTIGERKGSFKGMLDKRTMKIIWVSKSGVKESKAISYDGKAINIK